MRIFNFCFALAALFVPPADTPRANVFHSEMPPFPLYDLTLGDRSLVGKSVSSKWMDGSSSQRAEAVALGELRSPSLCHNLDGLMGELESQPQATDGRKAVYLPKERSDIVIKDMRGEFEEKIEQNTYANEIIQKKGVGEFLKVPKFCFYKNYLIEQRFPVSDQKNNFFLYYKDPQYFDDAVVAFMIFLKEAYLQDIIGDDVGDIARTDNVLPYIEESLSEDPVGRLALVDLDHLFLPTETSRKLGPEDVRKVALAFFPYHSDLVKEMLGRLYSIFQYPIFRFNQWVRPHLFEVAKSEALQNRHLRHWDFLIKNQKMDDFTSFSSVGEFVYTEDRMHRINKKIQKQIDAIQGELGSSYDEALKSSKVKLDSCRRKQALTKHCDDNDISFCCTNERRHKILLEMAPSEEDLKVRRSVIDSAYRFNALFNGEKTLPLIMNKIRTEFIIQLEKNIKDNLSHMEHMSFPDLAILRVGLIRNQQEYENEIGSLLSKTRLWDTKLQKIIFKVAMENLEEENNIAACKEYPKGRISFCLI